VRELNVRVLEHKRYSSRSERTRVV
jgi:hypothetical protein